MATAMEVGQRIRVFRALKRLSQSQLAKEIGANRKTISDWERGATFIATRYLFKISEKYDVSLSFFDPSRREDWLVGK
jgi:transcriptional regulator with XRE-family HTH domain